MMAGMAASLSGLVNGAPGLELFHRLIACGVKSQAASGEPATTPVQQSFEVMHRNPMKLQAAPCSVL